MTKELDRLKRFWRGKKVFITGHTGFKGCWLSIFLNILGAKLYGYSLKPRKKSLFEKISCKKIFVHETYGDISNFNELNKNLINSKAKIVFHLAAQPLVIDAYKDPVKTYKTNIFGTINLLESIKLSRGIKSVIIVTSDKVYKNKKKKIFFKECDELGGIDPYSCSKACKEIIVESYLRSFFYKKKGLNISTVRSGNVLGGGDYSKNRIVPDIIKSIKEHKKLVVRNSKSIRPWQHVVEPLKGYILLAEKQYKNQLKLVDNKWNFGPGKKNFITVKKILNKIRESYNVDNIILSKYKYYETDKLFIDSKKAKKYLKWYSKLNIDDVIQSVLKFEFSKNKNLKKIIEDQIVNYLR